ncbi:MAG: sulfate adenylyltransferase [Actinobacteria bacterium]|uniref:sulfate adenylyltransferase n=1 Tax=freshwater metagenome TaxID=449393 RepID=A0A6J6F3T3_9ZZZZ|nr:sulfate adenylyltransferase [Actinomycetota bacterium]
MELLRFATAGSVDDGKSTLIGRLLHDTKALFDDVIDAVAATTARRGGEGLDLALVTDGLRAEREQGITIDVAYRYFSTPLRSFVIADTPGHVQYTRNMVTGASTSDVAVILVDARHGLREQSRRHAALSALLGIQHLVLAVNKMDLVDWSEARFEEIRAEFAAFAEQLHVPVVTAIPLCALDGGNVVDPSPHTPWYQGPTLLEHLETLEIPTHDHDALRLPVQVVIKPAVGSGAGPTGERRWYAGSLAGGLPEVGDEIVVLPSGTRSRIAAVEGNAPAVRIQLEHELDVSRGDVIADAADAPHTVPQVTARVAWMGEKPLRTGNHVLIKHGTRTVKAVATILHDRLDVTTLEREHGVDELALNEIGTVTFITAQSLPVDDYATNRTTGSFIVIDEVSNGTVGAGMVTLEAVPA